MDTGSPARRVWRDCATLATTTSSSSTASWLTSDVTHASTGHSLTDTARQHSHRCTSCSVYRATSVDWRRLNAAWNSPSVIQTPPRRLGGVATTSSKGSMNRDPRAPLPIRLEIILWLTFKVSVPFSGCMHKWVKAPSGETQKMKQHNNRPTNLPCHA